MTTIATATLPKNVQYPQATIAANSARVFDHFGFGAFSPRAPGAAHRRVLNNVGGGRDL
ncbi:hypothetical protein MJ584_19100 [Klebsiella pneumoniae]|nr:hypothetical protein MJ584_19100 [Klebsiella pneumoniae]